jgi:hypothetical protein
VLKGEPVEGVRYPAPPHMTDWYLATDRYKGDVATLEVIHLHHVFAARPELVGVLGLAPGYFFNTSPTLSTGYSEDIAKDA